MLIWHDKLCVMDCGCVSGEFIFLKEKFVANGAVFGKVGCVCITWE